MKIIKQRLMIPRTVVRGVKTYIEYPLQFFTIYDDNGVAVEGGLAPAGAMELPGSVNIDDYEVDGLPNSQGFEMAPMLDPTFVTSYDDLGTRVEM